MMTPEQVAEARRAQIAAGGGQGAVTAATPADTYRANPFGAGAAPALPRGVRAVPRYSTDPRTGERTQVGIRYVSGRGASRDWRSQVSPEARAYATSQAEAATGQSAQPPTPDVGEGAANTAGEQTRNVVLNYRVNDAHIQFARSSIRRQLDSATRDQRAASYSDIGTA